MTEPTRRTVLKGAAWAVPVIAAAIAVPNAVASPGACEERSHLYDPTHYPGSGSMGPNNNVATILVTESAVVITYRHRVDLIDINVHKPSGNVNKHVNGRVQPGTEIVIPLVDCEDPTFIQIHGNDCHYYGGGVFR